MSKVDILEKKEDLVPSPKVTEAEGNQAKSVVNKGAKNEDPNADEIEDGVKTPKGTADSKVDDTQGSVKAPKSIKEDVAEMLASHDLSEDFKAKASVIFEAAIETKLAEEVERIELDYDKRLQEQTDIAINELVESVDTYLDYTVQEWMQTNEVAIDNGIRTEISESFMKGLYELMSEHHIDLPEDKVDVVAEMAADLEKSDKALSEATTKLVGLQREINESKRLEMVGELAEDLTAIQREKLEKLVENVEWNTPEEFNEKAMIIKEHYFSESTITEGDDVSEVETSDKAILTEGVDKEDSRINKYVDAISRATKI